MPVRKCSLVIAIGFGTVVAALGPAPHARGGPINWSRARGNWVFWVPVNRVNEDQDASPSSSTKATAATAVDRPASTPTPPQSPWWQYTSRWSGAAPVSGGFSVGAATPVQAPAVPPPFSAVPVSGPGVGSVSSPPAPAPAPAGYSSVTTAPVTSGVTTSPAPAPTQGQPRYDAFINFGNGPYIGSSAMTTGGGQAWYNSPSVKQAFGGGAPGDQQQAEFTSKVLQDVQQTFKLAGLSPQITTDPNARADHTLSVVSGTSYPSNPNAIGVSDVGNNGFGFIDKLNYAQNPDELARAVAHNVSHELMHAFGVGIHHDQTGQFLDSGTTSWSMLTDPNATFSAAAAQDIAGQLAQSQTSTAKGLGAQSLQDAGPFAHADSFELLAPPTAVPEPAAWAAWSLALGALLACRRKAAG